MKRRRIHANYISAAVLPAVSMLLILLVCDIVPFGDNTFLYNDMKREYADFYLYYRSVLEGRNNFLYSFSAGPGENMLGMFAYYLTSPLLLFLRFVSNAQLPLFLSFLISVKTVLLSLSVCFFLRYYLRKELASLPDDSLRQRFLPVISCSLAVSGYAVENMTNTMWMDAWIWMPVFFVTGLMLLESSGGRGARIRFLLCAFSTAVLIYLNYYIAYMVLLFAVLYLAVCAAPYKKRAAALLAVFAGGMLSACFSLPVFLSLAGGSRTPSAGAFSLVSGNLTPLQAVSRMFALSFNPEQIFFGVPALFPAAFLLPPVFCFFFSECIGKRQKRTAALLLAFLFASFCLEPLNALWHAGALPNGFQYRFAFLFLFVLAVCAAKAVLVVPSGSVRLPAAGILLTAALILAAAAGRYDYFRWRKVLLNLAILALCSVPALILSAPPSGMRRFARVSAAFLAAAVCVITAGNGIYIYRQSITLQEPKSVYRSGTARITAALDGLALPADDGFYRIETATPRSWNDALAFSYRGISLNSSLQHMLVRRFIVRLGFDDTGLYTVYEEGLPHTQDTVLSIFGCIYGERFEPSASPLPAVFQLPCTAEELAARSDRVLSFVDDPFRFSEGILQSYLPDEALHEQIFLPADYRCEIVSAPGDETARVRCTVTPAADGELYFYICGIRDDAHDYLFTREDWPSVTYGSRTSMRVIDLGHHRAGEEFYFLLEGSEELPGPAQMRLFTESDPALSSTVARIPRGSCRTAFLSSSHLYAAANGDGVLVLAVPYDTNWRCTVDGNPVSPVCLFDAYMALPLSGPGAHSVDLQYIPAGIKTGRVISVITALLLLLYAAVRVNR